MDFGAINWWAVVVCAIVSMIVGSLWFNPKTFFPVWWKGIGKSESDRPGIGGAMGLTWTLTILASLLQAVFMSLIVTAMGSMTPTGATLISGAITGALIW